MSDPLRVAADVSSEVVSDPVECGDCVSCGEPTAAAMFVDVLAPTGRFLILCVVCRECERGRSL